MKYIYILLDSVSSKKLDKSIVYTYRSYTLCIRLVYHSNQPYTTSGTASLVAYSLTWFLRPCASCCRSTHSLIHLLSYSLHSLTLTHARSLQAYLVSSTMRFRPPKIFFTLRMSTSVPVVSCRIFPTSPTEIDTRFYLAQPQNGVSTNGMGYNTFIN